MIWRAGRVDVISERFCRSEELSVADDSMYNVPVSYYTYIMTNKRRTVLYVGVTNNISRRVGQHEIGGSGFTSKYEARELVYFEEFPTALEAITREKQIKGWRREKKLELIRRVNPGFETVTAWCDALNGHAA